MSAILKSSPFESFVDTPHLSVSFDIQDGRRTLVSLIVHTAKYACRREARFLKVNYLPGKVYLTLSNK